MIVVTKKRNKKSNKRHTSLFFYKIPSPFRIPGPTVNGSVRDSDSSLSKTILVRTLLNRSLILIFGKFLTLVRTKRSTHRRRILRGEVWKLTTCDVKIIQTSTCSWRLHSTVGMWSGFLDSIFFFFLLCYSEICWKGFEPNKDRFILKYGRGPN